MFKSWKKIVLYQLVTVFTLSGCSLSETTASAPPDDVPDLDYRGSDCILIRTIRDYTPLDKQHLLIRGPGRRAYYVALFGPAYDMRGSVGFSVDSRDDQLCPFGSDTIVFGGISNERVSVQSISRVTAEQEEQLLIRYGKKEPREPEAPAEPAKVKGAEVEELGQVEPGFL